MRNAMRTMQLLMTVVLVSSIRWSCAQPVLGDGISEWMPRLRGSPACTPPSALSIEALKQQCDAEPGLPQYVACSLVQQCEWGSIAPSHCGAPRLWATLCAEQRDLQLCQRCVHVCTNNQHQQYIQLAGA